MFLRWILVHTVCAPLCLCVTFPPSFTQMPPKNAVFIPGEAIKLPCVAIGAPAPKYIWYKNGKEFNWAANTGRYTKWPDEGTLIMARPGTDDDGMYQCFAINQFGISQSNVINVKRAELGDFELSKTKIVRAQHGQWLVLTCNVPLGYPPPVVTWQTEKNSQIQYIKENNRRATDINGYLYIAAVIEDDHDTTYTCVANNEVLRYQKSGPSYRIQIYGQQTNYPLTELYRTPRTEVTVVGEKLNLKCIFGGYPEPQYTWFKDGKEPINLPNVNVQNMGTMLEINPVTEDAAGEYRCQGSNEQTRVTLNAQYTVQVQVRPTFVEKPEDITVPVNESVIFRCTAKGKPAPQIRWTVNGGDPSHYLDGKRKILRGNTMELYNLTIKDTAVIQCNASNAFGYAFTNAYVNVMREPPYFIKPPQTELRAVDGHPVTLFCQTFSAPKALISWSKDGRPINGGRYQNMENGDLFISAIAITDSGVYECTATNPFGSRKAWGRLMVRRQTSIVLAPIDTQVYEGQVVKFVCTAETDPLELANLKITWYKDDNLINPDMTPRIQRVWFDYSLVLSGAQPRDTGQYRCNASNGLDFAYATASLLVQGRPEQAINVQVNCVEFINEELALVSWYPGSDNYAPIMEYIVEYSTQYEQDTWYPAEIFNYTGLIQSTSIKVVLRPAILYRFRVRTRNWVGISLPSKPTKESCGIPSRVPAINPKELYVYGSLRNNLIIRWTTLPYIEHYGSNLGYILTVSCLNCDIIPRTAVNTTVVGDWRTDTLTYTSFRVGAMVYEMETYKEFVVTIQSRNEKGVSTAPPTVAYGFSGEAVPTVVPPSPTILSPTSRGANLQWQAITAAQEPQVQGYFRGYRVEWCLSGLTTTDCETNKRFQDVILRIPNTPVLYTFRKRRAVRQTKHPDENAIPEPSLADRYLPPSLNRYRTGENAPEYFSEICHKSPRRNISCPGVGEFPRAAQSPSVLGEATLFRSPRQTPNTFQTQVNRNAPTTLTFQYGQLVNYTLTGVPGATSIRVWLRILNTRFAGPMGAVASLTTLEDVPGPVANLRASAISVNYADIIWTPPTEPNGNLTGYEFEAMELKGLEMGFGFRYPNSTNATATSYRMPRLKPNTTYRITVWPKTAAGLGVDTFIDLTTAPSDVAPEAPSFAISAVGLSNFTVIYEPSHTGIPGTVFFVQYRQPGIIHWLESEPTFIEREIVVNQLLPDTSYEVRMVATNGAFLSTESATRLVHTLGGPGPDSLTGPSGTWFIIVCVLLLTFVAFLILLVLLRTRRLREVQKRAEEPAQFAQPSEMSPEYAQPLEPSESRRLLGPQYPPSNISVPKIPSQPSEAQWSPSEGEEGMSDFEPESYSTSQGLSHGSVRNGRQWDTDGDLVRPADSHVSPLRSGEEEAELELDPSFIASGSDELESEIDAHPLAQPNPRQARDRRDYGPTRRAMSPPDISSQSHVSGDPTLI
ncbi:Neuroglian [Fasciola hepatica]|uniref:Neuroglian n=1 Tax=Fasciola hepatica TaxID=6192 RepID=A0A4E0S2U8_FASHE|nr:Neuroglian [Fasciola hepatica]